MQLHQRNIKRNSGFTLIEAMVAIAIFTIIMVIGISALLSVNSTNKKSQNQRTIMDNLNFVMEDMTRNFKLGSYYHCVLTDEVIVEGQVNDFLVTPQDCGSEDPSPTLTHTGKHAAAVEPMYDANTGIGIPPDDGYPDIGGALANAQDQIIYQFDSTRNCALRKSINGGVTFVAITPPEIQIDCAASGFNVFNTDDEDFAMSPRILIRISGMIDYKGTITPFSLQTSASQRNVNLIAP